MNSLPKYHRSWLRCLGLSLLVLVIAAVGIGGWMLYVGVSVSLQAEENLHATLFTIRLVEQFVHDKGRWPASWDELDGLPFPGTAPSPLNGQMSSKAYIGGQHGYEWPGETKHVKECVAIDFQIDQGVIARQDPKDFTAISPIGPCYQYRDYGFVQSLQQTLRLAIESNNKSRTDERR
jgi:hypothetical protein